MDEKLPNDVDEETADSGEESGPLGRLLEHSIGSGRGASEGANEISNEPSQPSTVVTAYSEGTHEHDDDREG